VVAAIILIAVTVAVSIAAATWMGSISFSFMKVDELKVSSHTWASGNSYIDLVLKNLGTTTFTISDVKVDGVAVTTVTFPSGNATLGAGDTSILRVIHSFTSAVRHEFTIITASGTKCVYIASASSVSQLDWTGDGSDGPLDVSIANQVVNDYASLAGNENAGETTITVSDTSGFGVDDEILLIQMQNSSGGEAGTYEFKHISSIMGNDITLTSALDNSYYSGSFDSVDATAFQIVRVPQYTSVTVDSGSSITSPAWDGYTGGIVVFRAETVTINNGGSIDVSEKGYRGGAYGPSYNLDGYQGESYLGKGIGGSSTYGVGKMNNAGAGGSFICGGGGEYGGYATDSDPWREENPDTYARKGEVYGTADLTKIFFGSGGGGQWNGNNPDPSDGGNGGGIIIIYANLIVAPTDSFLAVGETTSGIQEGLFTYGSSGGAGGAIFLHSTTIQGETNFCRATGGSGNHLPLRDGGDGGVGRIRLDYAILDGTTTPSPGYTGSIS